MSALRKCINIEQKFAQMPRHIAIIMDGNGRWAKKRMMPRTAGHVAGSNNFRKIVLHAASIGVPYLSLYVFSTENWSRPPDEVEGIMNLFIEYLKDCLENFTQENIKIHFIGDTSVFSDEIKALMKKVEQISAPKTGMVLNLAVNYGGKTELVRAARLLAEQVYRGEKKPEDITADAFADSLYTAGQPDVDLLIRTGGDIRVSNFLLWQIAYAEIIISEKMWPDFSNQDLERAIQNYNSRERRFGGLKK